MESKQLDHIKKTYEDIQAGISNPVHINTAYTYLPQYVENTPMIAKIRAINRFMMLSYHDELKRVKIELSEEEIINEEIPEGITDSIGTMENLPKQSHQEEIDDFITAEEKKKLSSKKAGTEFKRTRSPNGTRKPRK